MKRFLIAVLAALLAISGISLAETTVFSGSEYDGAGWSIYPVKTGGDLYIFQIRNENGERTYGYSVMPVPEASLSMMENEIQTDGAGIDGFCGGNDGIYAWCSEGNEIRINAVTPGGAVEEICAFDGEDAFFEGFSIIRPVIVGDFFMTSAWDDGEGRNVLAVYDMVAERADVIDEANGELVNVVGVCEGGEGTALVLSAIQGGNFGFSAYRFDPADSEMEFLGFVPTDEDMEFFFGGEAYDAENGVLYFTADKMFYSLTNFDPETLAKICEFDSFSVYSNAGFSAALTDDGRYVCAGGGAIVACPLEPEKQQNVVLTVCGGFDDYIDDACDEYRRTHDGTTVRHVSERIEGESVSTDMLSKSDQYDVYILNVGDSAYQNLYDRGYLQPIQSEKLKAAAARLYPKMQEIVMKDGQLVAVPEFFSTACFAYDPTVLEDLGLTEGDVPTTWSEFLALLKKMPEILEGSEWAAFDRAQTADGVRRQMMYEILDSYCMLAAYGDIEIDFDGEEMAALMAQYEGIDFSAMGQPESRDDRGEGEGLFYINMEADLVRSNETLVPMPLAFSDDTTAYIEGEMDVMVINPYSKNPDAAEEFIETVLDFMPGYISAAIYADWEGGVKIEGADENLADADNDIAAIQAEIEKAGTDEERAKYEEMLETAKMGRENVLKNFYWEVSPAFLEQYQSYAECVRISKYLGIDVYEELYPILDQYLDGGIDAREMLRKLDGKITIMLGEN